jgi:RimJ/RimL family protein N-acetyltransferase
MICLETERLIIRNFRGDDWEALHATIGRYAASELAAYDHPWPTAPEEIRKVVEWFAGGDAFLAVCLKETGRFIGFVALNPEGPEDDHTYNLGYVFDFDYHGHGYATEACRALIDHAFAQVHAQQVVSGTAAANRASCRLLERLGFRKTGESTGSLENAPDDQLLVFVGYRYTMTCAEWALHRGRVVP